MSHRDLAHEFRNCLSVIEGFCDLALEAIPQASSARRDVVEIQKAARAAIALLPDLERRLGGAGANSDEDDDASQA